MNGTFIGFSAVWHGLAREWPVWIAARCRAHASVCAMVTFAVLQSQAAKRPS